MSDIYRAPDAPAVAPGARTDGAVPTPGGPLSYIHWGPVIAGAVVAAAASFVLMTFAGAIGLAVASPSPTWRDTSIALAILSGLWILLVAVGSSALGGYLAGRVRSTWATSSDEIEFRDGAHGLLVWALAIVVTGFLVWATATTVSAVTAAGSTQSRVTAAETALAYELDRLFRSDKRPEPADQETRAEAGRILITGLRRDMRPEDRTYLNRLVAARTGLAPADAERRVIQVVTEAQQAARRARASGIIIGFMTAASLAAAAVAAWFAAGVGGRHRDHSISPPLRWDWRRRAAA
jgi:hypothetical protein